VLVIENAAKRMKGSGHRRILDLIMVSGAEAAAFADDFAIVSTA